MTERRAKWHRLAKALAARHSEWTTLQIASAIQRFRAGRRRSGPLTYSVGYICKNIQAALGSY